MPPLMIRKLSAHATLPTRGSPGAAGLDLYAAHAATVPARGHVLVRTDLCVMLPENTYGRVAARSGLALRHGLLVGAGVIDEDYRGNVGVLLFNHSDVDVELQAGERVAQLIVEKILRCDVVEAGEPDDTARGERGFGSTGR